MTNKQKVVYDTIVDYINTHGYSPTVRELAEILGYKSSSTMHSFLKALEDKGYIKRVGVRAIEIVERDIQ